ncbi:hypothetical protein IJJ12_02290 [bacterium]|nr:hypothetical protein [bacterium]
MDTQLRPSGQVEASHRQTLGVIWARFKLYEATGDQNVLSQLKADLGMMTNLLASHQYTLQTDRFNCLLMRDLVNSDQLSDELRAAAKLICDYGEFEYYPDGDILYDVHQHPIYHTAAAQATGFISDEYVIEVEADRIVPEEQVVAYQTRDLIVDINSLLEQYATYGETSPLREQIVDTVLTRRFITRELYAALDQAAAYKLNSPDNAPYADATLRAQNELDFLLLLRETLAWYTQADSSLFGLFDNDACLLSVAVRYYAQEFGTQLSASTLHAALDRINQNELAGQYSSGCQIADHALNQAPLNKDDVAAQIALNHQAYQVDSQAWSGGFLYSYDGQTYFNLIWDNALAAGILAASK